MKLSILSLLILALVVSPALEIGYARSGRSVLWDTGADITLLKQHLEKIHNYRIQPFDLLPAIDTQGPVQLMSQLIKVDYVVTTATQLLRLLEKVPALKKAVIRAADVPSVVHVLLKEPGDVQRSCSTEGADIRCLASRGSQFLTTHGSSASAAAVITTVLPDLGPDCETGSRCTQVALLDQERQFANFLAPDNSPRLSTPHVVVSVAQIRGDSSLVHSAALPDVAMVALESISAAMKTYGFYPFTITSKTYGGRPKSPVPTVENITVLVSFTAQPGEGTWIVDKHELRAQRVAGATLRDAASSTGGNVGTSDGGRVGGGGSPGGYNSPGGGYVPGSDQNSASLVARLGDLVPKQARRIMLEHLLDLQYSSGKRIELDNALFEFLRQN